MRNTVFLPSCLITGSGGFIGRNLKEYLNDKYNLLCPRSRDLDLRDKESVERYFSKHSVDFIIHCATKGGVRGVEDLPSVEVENLQMYYNILDCKKNDTKVIVFGSGAMYDKSRPLHKVKETELFTHIPKEGYGKSKLEIAKDVLERDDVVCLNIFGCYGRYEKTSRFPTYVCKQILNSKPVLINTNSVFDYLYIDDLCRIVNYFISHDTKDKIINVTPSKSISMIGITEIIGDIVNMDLDIIVNDDNGNEYTGDNRLLLKYLPHFRFTEYEMGLQSLIVFLRNDLKCIDKYITF